MFTLRVDDEIELQLLEKHHKEGLYELIDQNRNHLNKMASVGRWDEL